MRIPIYIVAVPAPSLKPQALKVAASHGEDALALAADIFSPHILEGSGNAHDRHDDNQHQVAADEGRKALILLLRQEVAAAELPNRSAREISSFIDSTAAEWSIFTFWGIDYDLSYEASSDSSTAEELRKLRTLV